MSQSLSYKHCLFCDWEGDVPNSARYCPECGEPIRHLPQSWVDLTARANRIVQTFTRQTGKSASEIVEEALVLYLKGEICLTR